jgi:hypothetical protein
MVSDMTQNKNDRTSMTVSRDTLAELAKRRISRGYDSYDSMIKEELLSE